MSSTIDNSKMKEQLLNEVLRKNGCILKIDTSKRAIEIKKRLKKRSNALNQCFIEINKY